MTRDYQYTVWQPGQTCLGKFLTFEDAQRFRQSMVAMGATDARIFDLELREVEKNLTTRDP